MILNLGCGGSRPVGSKWINIDDLHSQFPDAECPERIAMDAEPNYLNHDIETGLPYADNSVDGILASHLLEHFDCIFVVELLKECRRVLKPGGVLRVSVPDPQKFHELTLAGCEDWGEPNKDPDPDATFMDYALFFYQHVQLITKYAMFCMFYSAGFREYKEMEFSFTQLSGLADLDNRDKFSSFYEAVKV